MDTHFIKVRNYILELEFDVTHENEEEGIIVIKRKEQNSKFSNWLCRPNFNYGAVFIRSQ